MAPSASTRTTPRSSSSSTAGVSTTTTSKLSSSTTTSIPRHTPTTTTSTPEWRGRAPFSPLSVSSASSSTVALPSSATSSAGATTASSPYYGSALTPIQDDDDTFVPFSSSHGTSSSSSHQIASATSSASSSTSSSIRRTSKLASISHRQSLSSLSSSQQQSQQPSSQQSVRRQRSSYLSPQQPSTSRAYSAATTPTGNEFSPPRASLEAIQRRLYEEGQLEQQQQEQQHQYQQAAQIQHDLLQQASLDPTSATAAAAVLVLHALQSPAKIGSSPAKGRGVTSIFPPSPDGRNNLPSLTTSMTRSDASRQHGKSRARSHSLRSSHRNGMTLGGGTDETEEDDDEDTDVSPAPPPIRRRSLKDRENEEMHPLNQPSSSSSSKSINMLSACSSASRLPKKRFDMSDWQFDLAAIASAPSPGDVKTPTSRSFPSSLNDEHSLEVSPAPTLQGRASSIDLKPSLSNSQKASRHTIASRDPFKMKRSNNVTFSQQQQASVSASTSQAGISPAKALSMTAPQPSRQRELVSRPPLQYRPNQPQPQTSFGQAGSASLFGTPLAGDNSSFASPFASTRRSTRPLSSRISGHSRTHSRNKSNEHDVKNLRSSTDTPLASSAAKMDQISSSFDACASAIRHRQRTKSISESEGNASDSEDDAADESLNLPESPDLLMGTGEGRDGYIEAGIFSGMSFNDVSKQIPSVQTSTDEMQLDEDEKDVLERQSPNVSTGYEDSHDSLFLDTPGRSRGSSMPSGTTGSGNQASYTLTTSLPFYQPQLKPSRVSYPPKILYTSKASGEEDDSQRAKNPLHSSVPASTKGTPGASRPLDQLFLASILNGTSPLPSASMSVKRQPSISLSKSTGNSLIRNTSETLKSAKSLQPLSPNASHVGRKRNAHGAMITTGSREASQANLAGKKDINGESLSQLDMPGGRPSLDGSTDEESGLSPTLPPLTDSSSATSSLASSQRSSQFPKLSHRDNANKPQTVSEHEGENSSSLDDLSFLSDSTMPSFNENKDSRMPRVPRTFSTSRDLSDSVSRLPKPSGQLKSPGTPGLPSGIPRRTSPHFRNVRPLQAAFMNSGLLSKKAIRSRLDRDSGIGLGGTPPALALRRVLNQERKDNSNLSMHSTPGSQPSLSFSTPSHYSTSFSSIQPGSPVPTVEIAPSNSMDAEAFANASSSSLPRRMPDTPCKRPPLYAHVRQPTTAITSIEKDEAHIPGQGLHPLAQCSRPTTGRSASSCSSTVSDSSSVVNSIPGSAVKLKERAYMSPSYAPGSANSNRFSRKSNGSGSPSSAGSPCATQENHPKSAIPRRRVGPALFRRRSSGQIQTSANGSFMALSERSGGSTRSGVNDWEPMTPTRTYAEQEWLALPSLTTSPNPHPPANRPFLTTDVAPAEASMVSPTSPLAYSPLGAQSTRFHDNRNPPASLPRPGMPQVKHLQRPAFRARHSSSVVHTARQSEMMSPDRFSTFFSINRMLGQGEFSEAFEVRDRSTDEIYAVKKTKVPLAGHKARLRRLEEVDILRLLSKDETSPFIIRLFDAWEQAGNLYIQTELCPFGNLAFFLEEYGRMYEFLDEARVWKILSEVTSGVAYIHQHGVLHLDLKPANIFISSNGSLKIGDFGLATRWPRVKPITILHGAAVHSPGWDAAAASTVWLSERSRSQSSNDKQDAHETVHDLEREGDREYIAPEILRGQYGRPADMFALGLLILEAAANVVLPDNGLPWRKLRENDLSDVEVGHLSDELVYIIVHLLQSDPHQRTTVDELQAHPVVNKMQKLRQRGFELEALPDGEQGMAREAEQGDSNRLVLHAKGAIVEESSDFLPHVMAEVRRIWHSPRKSKLVPSTRTPMQEDSNQMEIDA